MIWMLDWRVSLEPFEGILEPAVGIMSFGALLFLSGSQPWALPWIYVAFAAFSLPLRVVDFIRRKWIFFLFDFCYVSSPTDKVIDLSILEALLPW